MEDYAHLLELAFRKNSPLPREFYEVKEWGGAIDVSPERVVGPGVLRKFCAKGETVREGYRRRLVETEGVVATSESALGTSLTLREISPHIPPSVQKVLQHLHEHWEIGGEYLKEAVDFARACRQVASGFYYRWDWPGGVVDKEWLRARSAWNSEVREKLKQSRKGMDSPLLLAQAADRWLEGKRDGCVWHSSTRAAWNAVKDRPKPPTVAEWIDDFVVDYSILWAQRQKKPCIIWYDWACLGQRIAKKGNFPLYGAGTDPTGCKHDVIVCSIPSHAEGRNLQDRFALNLLTAMPPSGKVFEQLAGRTHRPGQPEDEVLIEYFAHTDKLREALEKVIDDALYVEESTGAKQKVLYATRIAV